MAKNDSNNLNGNVSFNKSINEERGMYGYAQNSMARNRTNQFAFKEDTGFLDTSIQNADALIKKLEEIEKLAGGADKLAESMTKRQRESYNSSKNDVKLLLQTLQEVRNTGQITQDELNQLVKDNETTSKAAMKTIQLSVEKTLKAGENASTATKEFVEDINTAMAKTNETLTKQKSEIAALNKQLDKSQDSFAKGMSKTLKTAGDKLSGLSNMFNLQNIADTQIQSKAQERARARATVMSQLGIGSTGQFESFRSSLQSELESMNASMSNIFNTQDYTNYMQKLDTLGITNERMAQEQMRASLIGNKYLGVSDETQQQIFKFMKRTNTYDMLDKHNQTIVGLLNSGLGVSKDQLDALSQIAYSDNDSKLALGMSSEAVQAQDEALTSVTAALTPIIGEDSAKEFSKSINDFITNPGDSGWASVLGENYMPFYNQVTTDTSVEGQTRVIQEIINQMAKSSLFSGQGGGFANSKMSEALNEISKLNTGVIASAKTMDLNKFNENVEKALSGTLSTTTSDVEQYAEDTSGTTAIENLQNWLDTLIGKLPWSATFSLANAAFTAYLASGAFDVISKIKDAGGLKNLMSGLFKGSAVEKGATASTKLTSALTGSGGILATGGGIALGLGAANLIASAIDKAQSKTIQSNTAAAAAELKGTSLAGNSTAESLTGLGNSLGDNGTNKMNSFGSAFSSTVHGLGIYTLGWTRDLSKINQDDWEQFQRNMSMRRGNKEAKEAAALAWAMLLMSARRQSDVSAVSKYTTNEIGQILKSKGWSKSYMDSMVADAKPHPNKSKDQNQDVIDWNYLNIDGYHKNGLNWVPRDNYQALLHKGEMVLNEREADRYRQMFNGNIALLPSNSKKGIGGQLGGVEVGDYNSGYVHGHSGVDLYFGSIGTPVGSAVGGKVIESKDIPVNYKDGKSYHGKDSHGTAYSSYGRVVKVRGNDGETYIYAHLNERVANVGDVVQPGTLLGYSGTTGNSSGPHLHFEVQGKGNNSAAHAKYYTPYVRSANGASASAGSSSTVAADAADSTKLISNKKYIPSSILNAGIGGGDDGASRVVNSVDGGFNKLIEYLDSISSEQNEQRKLLETYSISKSSNNFYS